MIISFPPFRAISETIRRKHTANKENYLNAMAMIKSWLQKGIITEKDFIKAERKMMEKYGIDENSIFRMKLDGGDK